VAPRGKIWAPAGNVITVILHLNLLNRCRIKPNKEFETVSVHPKGTRARILLTSVFGPYAQDDTFGSRRINPMELYHNQVTRAQGCFSLRMFHRSWGCA